MVLENLMHFDGVRYGAIAWCVMPNHVHVVIRTLGAQKLAAIVQSWKSYTAKRVNEMLGRAGAFWSREYFDRIVRDSEDLRTTVAYVVGNPKKAGLENWRWVGVAGGPPADRPAGGRRA